MTQRGRGRRASSRLWRPSTRTRACPSCSPASPRGATLDSRPSVWAATSGRGSEPLASPWCSPLCVKGVWPGMMHHWCRCLISCTATGSPRWGPSRSRTCLSLAARRLSLAQRAAAAAATAEASEAHPWQFRRSPRKRHRRPLRACTTSAMPSSCSRTCAGGRGHSLRSRSSSSRTCSGLLALRGLGTPTPTSAWAGRPSQRSSPPCSSMIRGKGSPAERCGCATSCSGGARSATWSTAWTSPWARR
mmetsp:Transcript_40399/g.125722  ORF Transcript_40399/g.125722 Transcript_40399/m.125722 type:complete len:247 (-) Transcript_40399:153-893(-)